MYIVISVCFKV